MNHNHRVVSVCTSVFKYLSHNFSFRELAPALMLFVLLEMLSVNAYAGDNTQSPLATNLNGITDFSDEFPFVDLMKSARPWVAGRQGCFDCSSRGQPGAPSACNEPNICPTADALPVDSDGYVTSLNTAASQEIRTIFHAGNAQGRLPAGNYTVRFEGAGTFVLLGGTLVNQSPGQFVMNVASSANNNIGFSITSTTVGNHLRNIRILPPGGVCANDQRRFCDGASPCASGVQCQLFTTAGVAEQQIFHPRFLTNTAPYRMIRFMDWMGTNSSPIINFSDYPKPSSAFWNRAPPEIMAELGNRLSSDIAINIPHLASDAFIDTFAARLRDNFRSDRKIYIEYSNENWNGIFQQNVEIPRSKCPAFIDLASGCQDDGIPGNNIACERNPDTFSLGAAGAPCFEALVRAWGDRSVQIFNRFDTVFGSSARQRLVRVVAAQAANPDLGRQVMQRNATGTSTAVSSKTDAYAIAPYFGTEYCTPDNGINPDTSPSVYASTAALLDHIEANALSRARGFMTTSKTMLQGNFSGIRLMSYEGGQHLAGIGQFTFDDTCNSRFDAANRDPRMQSIYLAYLADWKANGDEFTHFINAGRWDVFGYWGALEFQDQSPASSPKYTAITQHIAGNPCQWTNCVQPSATISINNVSITEGASGNKSATFTVSLSKISASPVTYNISTNSGGTATVTTDYTGKTLLGETIPPGSLSKTFSILIKGDTTIEANETFLVNISAVTGATIADSQGVGTILNDDPISLSINDVSVGEGSSGTRLATFTVSLSQLSTSPVTYTIATAGGGTATVTTDYTGKTLTGETIAAGTISKSFSVIVKGDSVIENNETFLVKITNLVGATVADSQGVGTIVNDDPTSLSINDVSVTEGNSGSQLATFTVSLSQVAAVPVTYTISTNSGGTATVTTDYTGKTLVGETIPPGSLSRTFTVSVKGDTAVEANETFFVNLTNPGGASIVDSRGVGTIINND